MRSFLVYDKTWTTLQYSIRDFISFKLEYNLKWQSPLTLGLPTGYPFSTKEVLQKKNQIWIRKSGVIIWKGIINSVEPTPTELKVLCNDFSDILAGRFIEGTLTYTGANIGVVVNSLLDYAESKGPTYITTRDIFSTKTGTFEFTGISVYDAILQAVGTGSEWFVYRNTFVMQDVVWVNQIQPFLYDEFNAVSCTIMDLKLYEEWKNIVNKLYAKWQGPLVATAQNPTSITKYGLFESTKTFQNANDLPTLQRLADEFVLMNGEEYVSVSFKPIVKNANDRWQFFIGDTATVKIKKRYLQLDKQMRIVKITYDVKQKSSINPWLVFEVSDDNIPGKWLLEDIGDMKKRIIKLENP